jgi:hypothetical protein
VVFGSIDIAVDEWRKIPEEGAPYLWKKRELYYDALHAAHDSLPDEAKPLFNDRLLGDPRQS